MDRRRGGMWALGLGGGVAAVYVGVAVMTAHLSSRPVRPLFDGFGTHSTYRWVKAPPDWAEENQQPAGAEFGVEVGAEGSKASTGTTPDSQVVVELPDGSLPAHDTDPGAVVTMTPLDAGTLGPLPSGLAPQSNAYRVTIERPQEPAGGEITRSPTKAKPRKRRKRPPKGRRR